MKNICGLAFLILISCLSKQKTVADNLSYEQKNPSKIKQDSLFELDFKLDENFVRIIVPKGMDFTLPDSAATAPYKFVDFNADNKEDVMIYLGACGTGGCMYGIFFNQYKNQYKLAFMDYLKGATFEKEKNGYLSIISYEEVEPYNPSKFYITKYKLDKRKYQYELDTTYISTDKH